MPVFWTPRFRRDWKKLPVSVKKRAKRAALLLEENRMHPSLKLKHLQRLPSYWEIRVGNKWRIVLTIERDKFTFVSIGPHNVLDKI